MRQHTEALRPRSERRRRRWLAALACGAASLAGVGIRAEAPTPDVSTLDAFKALLRSAPSIVYTDPKSGGAFGQYFARALVAHGVELVSTGGTRRSTTRCRTS